MFIGHFGLSFAAKKIAPQVSLGTMFIATQFVDILWPLFLVTGAERVTITPGYTKFNAFDFVHYPYTHSLFMGLVWGIVVGLIYWLVRRDWQGMMVVGLGVLSHWLLDVIVHVADLPWTPFGESKVGLGLWNNVAATLIVEGIIFITGLYLYLSVTSAKNKKGKFLLWLLIAVLVLITVSGLITPPPTGPIAGTAISLIVVMMLIVGLAYWVDRNRVGK